VLWFNPLVWLLAWQAHELREEAADDVVLRGDVRRADYAALLIDFARRERASPLAAAHGVSPSKDALKRRLTRVLDPSARRDPAAPAWALTCTMAALLIAAPVAAFTPVDYAPPAATEAAAASAAQAAQGAPIGYAKGQTSPSQAVVAAQAGAVEARAVEGRGEQVSAETLVAMRVHGITSEYIDEIERAYPPARNMNSEGFIGFRVLGVTPEWMRGISAAGYGDISPDQVQSFAALGVTPQYIREIQAAGLTRPTADEIQSMRANGVTGDYIRDLQEAGLTRLSAQDVLELRVHGVTADDARAFGRRGDPPLAGGPSHPPEPVHPPDPPHN
jgi:hypothetical protein